MADDLVGTTLLGKLRIVRRVGEGAFGEVYEALHTLTGHRRALKVLRPDRATDLEAVTRFIREARVTSRLESPHVAQVHDAGRLPDGRAYAVMDFLTGRSLRAVLEAEGRLAPARAVALVRQAAKGLAVVHDAGLLHRDLKPENLFVEDTESGELLRLLDFGLVSDDAAVGDALTREGTLLGSPAYMSGRRLDGEPAGPADDVYALGVVLYELIAGRRPFEGATVASLVAAAHRGVFPSLASAGAPVSASLVEVVDRALGKSAPPLGSARALDEALARAASARDGETIDRYTIVRSISRGGMGDVYEVSTKDDSARLAMKILRADRVHDRSAVARMRKEAKLAARVAGEHALPVLDDGTDLATGAPYFVMELLEGEDVGSALARGAVDPERAMHVLAAVAEGLDALHAAGLVHRDVKPENVFLSRSSPDPARPRVRILDLGVATLVERDGGDAGTTTASTIVGTPLYLAPEQVDRSRPIGPAVDRFALAQLAFSMLVGTPYFEPEASRGLLAIVSALSRDHLEAASARARRRGRDLPPGFDAWFARAAAHRPEGRFASCRGQIAALEAVYRDRPVARRARHLAVGLAVGLLAILVAGWVRQKDVIPGAAAPSVSASPVPSQQAPLSPAGDLRAIPAEPAAALPSTQGSAPPAAIAEPPSPSRDARPRDPLPTPRPQAAPLATSHDEAHDSPF